MEGLGGLRTEVREFIDQQLAANAFTPTVDSWMTGSNPEFTRALVEHGWIGMTIPTEYGGRGRTFMERFVVTEELLAAGAPVAAHWIADRQMAPSILRYGTQDQKAEFLPRIADGSDFWAIGMSEPDSGSDLASVRTRAVPVAGGWSITGAKVWTSGAHVSQWLMTLARTSAVDPAARHGGLSQFIVDLRAPGVQVRPIVSMSGGHHFNEVVLDDVFVPDSRVFGRIGHGWQQVTSELGFERSGPERILSSFPILRALVGEQRTETAVTPADLGRLVARSAGLHQMSEAVAGVLSRGDTANVPAAVVKVLGTATEGDIVDVADLLVDDATDPRLAQLVRAGVDQRPGFTIRGGSSEVLRGVIARELGMR
ncbi:acyl-CoA dehydrogenase domain-containing protein [Gordonia neofelifaecis NRRL B-59395]|uniref:Acyl-CoA dehydrogenase domain-containing protein n=1 Tax=Gordonia neofelifaecis NRRL B-59395 TaxID=644548 RepID=F1YGU7_9ACTN|nr:acyl-CoA dehydrogenase domain-containing protein [Gordonia neofelifaecis NRRL B-59395]